METKSNQAKEAEVVVTVDDLVPEIVSLTRRLDALEAALKHHEHNSRGEPVIRL